uniref:Integrase core domain containing protein n=1 Tax=Solanum tuberosum TaxID=4113 RepID=M1DYP1_SOLTU
MAKIMTQLDILSKNVMGAGARSVNAVGVGCANPDESKFEALYNEEVNFLTNQGGGYRSNYPRQGGNQGWDRDEGWKDRDREWRDRNLNWKDRENDRYVPPHESQKSKDSKGGRSEDMLSRILNKVEGSYKILKEMKDDVCTLSQTVTFHSVSIKQLETQMGVAELNSRSWVESRHVGSFGELGRARQTTRWFAKVHHLAFNFMLNVLLSSVAFGEKPEIANGTRRLAE